MHPSTNSIGRRRCAVTPVLLALALIGARDASAVVPQKSRPSVEPKRVSAKIPKDPAGKSDAPKKSAAASPETKAPVPQVEVFIPSIAALSRAAADSHAGAIYRALVGTLAPPVDETVDGFDVAALLKLFDEIRTWPDTSLALAIYTQDSDGRPRWVARTDWPLKGIEGRLQRLLESEAARKLLTGLALNRRGDGRGVVEISDTVLAVLKESGDGTMIASADTVELPGSVFGIKTDRAARQRGDPTPPVWYCRVNIAAADDEGRSSWMSAVGGIRDIRYQGAVQPDGNWNERVSASWGPMAAAFKLVFKRVKKAFECPRDAYFVAAINTDLVGGTADALAGLPAGTLGGQTASEFAIAVVPGTGFLPLPDTYFQFSVKKRGKAIEAVRKHLREDEEKRADEDLPPAWKEIGSEADPVFTSIPGADGASGVSFASMRRVVFFDRDREGEDSIDRLVVAQTFGFPDDAVANWKTLRRRGAIKTPGSPEAHWQARICWRQIYSVVEPFVGVLMPTSENAQPLPSAEAMGDALSDSVIDIRIEATGVRVAHTGPIPVGAFLVPGVVAEAIMSRGDPSSEGERERIACRNLRVLHHHAKLFKRDYGRWPANVAELDGYVDFATHPNLLWLPEPKRGLMAGLVRTVTGRRELPQADREKIDDSLYEIDWSPGEWKLKFRAGEFRDHQTIYIDAEGEIHRVPLKPAKDKKVARADSEE